MNVSPFMGSMMSLEPFGLCHSPLTAQHKQGLQERCMGMMQQQTSSGTSDQT